MKRQTLNIKRLLRQTWAKLTLAMPLLLMGALALGAWWLARLTPVVAPMDRVAEQRTEPDYLLTGFSVKTFGATGVLVNEIWGSKAKHYPHTDILEIDDAKFRSSKGTRPTVGQSHRAYSNADGSEVQLVGDALIIREAGRDQQGRELPKIEVRSEFLHAFVETEIMKSHQPVTVWRGADQFQGDAMVFNNIEGTVALDGRVRVQLQSKPAQAAR